MMERESEFWRFSLALYGGDGVPAACVALQDAHGLDVNLMLFALWLGSKGRSIDPRDIGAADEAVRVWRLEAVIPLRGVRRFLKEPPQDVDVDAAAALRKRVKAVELEAERLQQEALFALRPVDAWGAPAEPAVAGRCNLAACAGAFQATFDVAPAEAILKAYLRLIDQTP